MKSMPLITVTAALSTIVSGFTNGTEVQLFKPSAAVVLARKGGDIDDILAQVGDVLEKGDALILVRGGDVSSVIKAPQRGELKRYGSNVEVDKHLQAGDFVAVLQTKYVDGVISLDVNPQITDQLSIGKYCCIVVNEESFTVQVSDVTKHDDKYFLYFSSQDQLSELMVLLESTKPQELDISFQLSQK